MKFSLIAAVDKKFGIGKNNRLPWRLPSDLAYFSRCTIGGGKNAVIMGRKTWESLPLASRPLKDRLNIVLTTQQLDVPADVFVAHSLEVALKYATEKKCEEIFVIGGAHVYCEATAHPGCEKIYLTEIDAVFDCDAFFPQFDKKQFLRREVSEIQEENGLQFQFVEYAKAA